MKMRLALITLMIITGLTASGFAQFEAPAFQKTDNPVAFKILTKAVTLKNGAASTVAIKLSVKEGYHINFVPPVEVKAKLKKGDARLKAKMNFDSAEIEAAEKKVVKGESVYLDTSKEYSFNLTAATKLPKGAHAVTWAVTMFYCSDDDGVCFRKVVKKDGEINIQ